MCVLRVFGKQLDPKKFLEHSSLPAYDSWREGEPRRFGAKFYGPTHDEGGFKVKVSGKEWTDLPGQVADALEFLETFRPDLSALAASSDVEQVYLDFPFASPASAEPPIYQSVFLPPKLLALAGELGVGIEISVYPQISEDAR
jgi:hypothetical protein